MAHAKSLKKKNKENEIEIELSDSLYSWAVAESKRKKQTFNQFINEAIKQYLDARKSEMSPK